MRHPIAKSIAAVVVALVVLCGMSVAAFSAVRHIVSGWWNNPVALAALPETPRVHYESGAIDLPALWSRFAQPTAN